MVLPPDQRREADEEGQNPHSGDQQLGAARAHDRGVRDGPRDRQVAVQRDGAQVQDGRRAHPHVHRQPDGAPRVAKQPHLKISQNLKYSFLNKLIDVCIFLYQIKIMSNDSLKLKF